MLKFNKPIRIEPPSPPKTGVPDTPIRGNQSLLKRVGKIILIFSILLVSFYTAMLALLYNWGLTAATHNIVLQEADLFLQAYAQQSGTPLPNTQSFKGFIGRETVSDRVSALFPPDKWDIWPKGTDGIMYRYQKHENSESHYHLLLNNLPGTDEKFVLFYQIDVSDETKLKVWKKFKMLAIIGGSTVIGLLFFFRYFMRLLISPLGSLSRWMNKIDEDHPPEELPEDIKNDEIGQLANELHIALKRIHEKTAREKQFLRNASHELRTPISIIRSAMDVLEHKRKIGDSNLDDALKRIRRAGDTMKSVTEAILWLAVDRYHAPKKETTDLADIINEIINENKEIFKSKNIQLSAHISEGIVIEIEPILLRIALDNMVRNAFQYCEDGDITLKCLSAKNIEIVNTTPTYNNPSTSSDETKATMNTGGFGLGLSLVAKIAEKQGWQFSFAFEDNCAVSSLTL